jgi:hypothetical protein
MPLPNSSQSDKNEGWILFDADSARGPRAHLSLDKYRHCRRPRDTHENRTNMYVQLEEQFPFYVRIFIFPVSAVPIMYVINHPF